MQKPGQVLSKDKLPAMRPITIPPFMDKVIQSSILMVLTSIYEPWFDKLNRSFGFRTSKSSHDAITAICSPQGYNMKIAIEGDIKGAFDNVNREKLLNILALRIKDRKFLNLLKDRLDYSYFDTNKTEKPDLGIPQGGIDSPYLFNIYMHEFDLFVTNYMDTYCAEVNKHVSNRTSGKRRNYLTKQRTYASLALLNRKKEINKEDKEEKFKLIRYIR